MLSILGIFLLSHSKRIMKKSVNERMIFVPIKCFIRLRKAHKSIRITIKSQKKLVMLEKSRTRKNDYGDDAIFFWEIPRTENEFLLHGRQMWNTQRKKLLRVIMIVKNYLKPVNISIWEMVNQLMEKFHVLGKEKIVCSPYNNW